ncbi:unnamed protein product [Ascophyllum nodosum]
MLLLLFVGDQITASNESPGMRATQAVMFAILLLLIDAVDSFVSPRLPGHEIYDRVTSIPVQNSIYPKAKALGTRCKPRSFMMATLLGAAEAVRSGRVSSEQLVIQALERLDEADGEVGAFLSVQGPAAVEAAKRIDRKIKEGCKETLALPLVGVPLGVKDNLCTKGVPTTAASRILEGYRPSYDATVVSKLKQAGGIVLGKTNMDEYAMGSTTETSAYQITRNPRNIEHAPGGSSGGSAAAVASGAVTGALGTDTGGSVRQPASWCGVVGLKPTYGRLSRRGLIAYASSTDCVGPIASTVIDAAALLGVVAGEDHAGDSTGLHEAVPDYVAILREAEASGGSRPLDGVKVGVIREALVQRVQPDVAAAVKEAIDMMASLGAEVNEVSLPSLPQQCAAYYVNAFSEASANLARFDGIRYGKRNPEAMSTKEAMLRSRHDGFGDEVKQRIILGTFALSAGYSDKYYKRAQDIRAGLSRDLARVFERLDVLVCPTAPTTAYRLGEVVDKGVDSYADDVFTTPASLAGLPALSIPCGQDRTGLPIGLQLMGKPLSEDVLLGVGAAYEAATDWHRRFEPGLSVGSPQPAAAAIS